MLVEFITLRSDRNKGSEPIIISYIHQVFTLSEISLDASSYKSIALEYSHDLGHSQILPLLRFTLYRSSYDLASCFLAYDSFCYFNLDFSFLHKCGLFHAI